jgi:hypothetical protein
MPTTFFLALPPAAGENGTGAMSRSQARRNDLGYSGQLSFGGSFDQYGFTPQRAYSGSSSAAVAESAPRSE